MTHLEGPIVQSLYDMSLLSWGLALKPQMPLLGNHIASPESYAFGKDNKYISSKNLDGLGAYAIQASLQAEPPSQIKFRRLKIFGSQKTQVVLLCQSQAIRLAYERSPSI